MNQRLQDPAGAAPPDWRGLCEELVNHLQGRKDRECGWPGDDPEQDLLDRARAALAQPEPEVAGPADEELLLPSGEATAAEIDGAQATGSTH